MADRALFELVVTGTAATRSWAHAAGDLDALPWAALAEEPLSAVVRDKLRLSWTEAAFNEYCTAAAMGQLVSAMLEAGAPLDLVGVASTFPFEEMVHVDLCARLAMCFGGGAPIAYDPDDLHLDFDPSLSPRQRANELVVRVCCVGEEFSLPMLAGTLKGSSHPLVHEVLRRIVRDEAPHGQLGWSWLAWAEPDRVERARLAEVAGDAVGHVRDRWAALRRPAPGPEDAVLARLGALPFGAWLDLAERAMDDTLARLAGAGIAPR